MHIASTINAATRSSGDVPVAIVRYKNRRVFITLPQRYDGLVRVIRDKFPTIHPSAQISFFISTLDVCKGERVEIDESAYSAMLRVLDEIEVVVEGEVAGGEEHVDRGEGSSVAAAPIIHPTQQVEVVPIPSTGPIVVAAPMIHQTHQTEVIPIPASANNTAEPPRTKNTRFNPVARLALTRHDPDDFTTHWQTAVRDREMDGLPVPPPNGPEVSEGEDVNDISTFPRNTSQASSSHFNSSLAAADGPKERGVRAVFIPPSEVISPTKVVGPLNFGSRRGPSIPRSEELHVAIPAEENNIIPPPGYHPTEDLRRTISDSQHEPPQQHQQQSQRNHTMAPPHQQVQPPLPDTRFKVYISGTKPEHRAEFMTRGKHLVRKVLNGACNTFGLDAEQSRLMLVLKIQEEDGRKLAHEFECVKDETMAQSGVEPNARLIVRSLVEPLLNPRRDNFNYEEDLGIDDVDDTRDRREDEDD